MEEGNHKRFDKLDITATKTLHGDPNGCGF